MGGSASDLEESGSSLEEGLALCRGHEESLTHNN